MWCEIRVEEEEGYFSILIDEFESTRVYASGMFEDELESAILECYADCLDENNLKEVFVLVEQRIVEKDVFEFDTDTKVYTKFEEAWNELERRYDDEIITCKVEGREIFDETISKDELKAKVKAKGYVLHLALQSRCITVFE